MRVRVSSAPPFPYLNLYEHAGGGFEGRVKRIVIYLDETAKKVYLAETMAHRILAFYLSVSSGSISNQKVLALVPTPDKMRLGRSP